jgi:hypothetical protein
MIKISINDKESGLKKDLQIKKTMSGDYVMSEHPDMDIVIMPQASKILLLTKGDNSDFVYREQDKLLKHMSGLGIVAPESIKGGNVYGSLEGTFPQNTNDGLQGLMVALYNLAQYIEDERPVYKSMIQHKKDLENSLLNPDIKDSTELGEVPQEIFKGSIPKYGFPTRGVYRYNY